MNVNHLRSRSLGKSNRRQRPCATLTPSEALQALQRGHDEISLGDLWSFRSSIREKMRSWSAGRLLTIIPGGSIVTQNAQALVWAIGGAGSYLASHCSELGPDLQPVSRPHVDWLLARYLQEGGMERASCYQMIADSLAFDQEAGCLNRLGQILDALSVSAAIDLGRNAVMYYATDDLCKGQIRCESEHMITLAASVKPPAQRALIQTQHLDSEAVSPEEEL